MEDQAAATVGGGGLLWAQRRWSDLTGSFDWARLWSDQAAVCGGM